MTDPGLMAFADQYHAAAVEARAWANRDAAEPDTTDIAEIEGPPAWIVEFIGRHNQALSGPDRTVCPHIGDHPRVAHIAWWRPGSLACTRCAEAGFLDRLATLTDALTCSVCGQPGTLDTMTAGRAQNGPFILHFGVHRTCSWSQQ